MATELYCKDTQKSNDKIAEFCGGKLVHHPMLGDQYVFDQPGTHQLLMKCPPFGLVYRKSMMYDCDWNWLDSAIKECYSKRVTDELKEIFEKLCFEMNCYDLDSGSRMYMVYHRVIEFIDTYYATVDNKDNSGLMPLTQEI